jgi:putative transposase
LKGLSAALQAAIKSAQQEAARLWNDVVAIHKKARETGQQWPGRSELQQHTKGRYALHSQTVQMVCHQLLANVDATRARRCKEPESRHWLKYPHKEKQFFPLYWPAQAVHHDAKSGQLVVPMGRGRKSLVLRVDLDFEPQGVKLVWNEGYQLHLLRPLEEKEPEVPGTAKACVDLGEIHQAAVVTDTGEALLVSGRGMRSQKRLLSKQLGQLARKRSRCKKGSRRDRKLNRARRKRSALTGRRVRDLRHKGTRQVIDFCQKQGVGRIFIGDPRGVREKDCGRHHNQRVSRWEVGQDLSYLGHKAPLAGMTCFTGEERGTSSRCPSCRRRHKPKGRLWRCPACDFIGHRDAVGAVNMHALAFDQEVMFPVSVTYQRPGPERAACGVNNRKSGRPPGRCSSLDTGLQETAVILVLPVAGSAIDLSVGPQGPRLQL